MKLLYPLIISFTFLFADLRVKTGEEEFILISERTYFAVNDSKEKHLYESLIDNSINGKIAIDSINSISTVENMGFEFFGSTLLLGVFSVANAEGGAFISKQLAQQINAVIFSGLSILAGGIGYLMKFEKKYELKNDNCSNNSPCTEWIVINK